MIFYLVIAALLLLGTTALFGSHYLFYFSLTRLLPEAALVDKDMLFAIITFLALSFILSSIIAHVKENIITRPFYYLSGLWLGIIANLTLASLVIWSIIILSPSFTMENSAFLARILFGIALAYSAYGAWSAFQPRIKKIDITIPNLPDAWKGKKIVQISDIHLGHVYKNIFMKKVSAMVNSANPEMVVITGDLFDGMDGKLDEPLNHLNNIRAEKGVYFITGNHETILGADFVNSALAKTKIRAMKDEVVDIDGLKLIGINYPEHGETRDAVPILESMKGQFQGHPNVLLYHSPVNIRKFKESGINLQLSGHTHNYQIFPLNILAKFVFKGYNYGLYKDGHYSLYVTSGTGTWGPSIRTVGRSEIVVITLS